MEKESLPSVSEVTGLFVQVFVGTEALDITGTVSFWRILELASVGEEPQHAVVELWLHTLSAAF